MQAPGGSRGVHRFGDFEFDARTAELRRHGRKVRLREQPAQVLTLLLARPGELVTREEAQRALWPGDTFVDFEVGLNSAVKRLRDALADSAERPRFVETLPKRGYRFIAPVDAGPLDEPAAVPAPIPETAPHRLDAGRGWSRSRWPRCWRPSVWPSRAGLRPRPPRKRSRRSRSSPSRTSATAASRNSSRRG